MRWIPILKRYYDRWKNQWGQTLLIDGQKFVKQLNRRSDKLSKGVIGNQMNIKNIKSIESDPIDFRRGAMTIGNALEVLNTMDLEAPLSNTTIKFVGPAYSAQDAANSLHDLSGGSQNSVQLQTHLADFVGRLIGGNQATYGEIATGSSYIKEWIRMFGGASTVHSCYGTGAVSSDCYPTYSPPKTIDIPSVRK